MTKRNFIRVPFSDCASIKHENSVFFGKIENISLQGMYIRTTEELSLHTPVEVVVYFSPDDSFNFSADVVRHDTNGIGVQIKDMDVKSFAGLRDLVIKRCHDQERVLRETFRVTKSIH